jgi:hypothetical protein
LEKTMSGINWLQRATSYLSDYGQQRENPEQRKRRNERDAAAFLRLEQGFRRAGRQRRSEAAAAELKKAHDHYEPQLRG